MNEEYTPDIVSIVDEDGKEHIFEELDRIETDSGRYVALLPLPESPDKITEGDRKSTRLNSSHRSQSRMPSSA